MSKREDILQKALFVHSVSEPQTLMTQVERHEYKMRAVFEQVLNQYLPPDAEEQA